MACKRKSPPLSPPRQLEHASQGGPCWGERAESCIHLLIHRQKREINIYLGTF